MKKRVSFKKIIIFVFVATIIYSIAFISWQLYRANNISVVPIEDIHSISISTDDIISSDTEVTGEININRFEEVKHINTELVDEILYIIIHKQPALIKKSSFTVRLDDIYNLESIKNISIISGDIYTGEGVERGYSTGDLKNIPVQKVIWEES